MSQFPLFYFPPPVPIIQPELPRIQQDCRIKAFRFLRENIGVVANPSEVVFGRANKRRRLNPPSLPKLSHLHCSKCDPFQKVIKVEDPLGKTLY
jgi:hypothetical protein